MSDKQASKALDEAVTELEAARETARLKVHLLSMDARSALTDLEGKFETLTANLEQRSEKVLESSATAARDLARAFRHFVEKQL